MSRCLHAFRAQVLWACVPLCLCFERVLIFLSALRAFSCLCPLLAFTFFNAHSFCYAPYVLLFFYAFLYLHFIRALRAITFWRALVAFIYFTWRDFLRAYVIFMYIVIKITEINELAHGCLSLALLNSVICQCFSSVLSSIKFEFSFLKQKILITFHPEASTWPFERLKCYLERETERMLKSFTIRRH